MLSAGVDAMGLNFFSRSPRFVQPDLASQLADVVADKVCLVGLFVDHSAAEVQAVLDQVPLDLLQFHGNESNAFCVSFGRPFMKVHRVRSTISAADLEAAYPDARWHLLDTYVPGRPGGTGVRFDWQHWPADSALQLGLAGGLTPENVAAAVRQLRPDAVDVSGGVEGAHKGAKDPARIREFVAAVREADAGAGSGGS